MRSTTVEEVRISVNGGSIGQASYRLVEPSAPRSSKGKRESGYCAPDTKMATLSRASGSLKAPLASCLASTSRLQLPQVTTSATRSYATEESPAWGTFQQDSSMSSDRQRAASNAQKADELSQVLKPLRQKGRPFLNVSRETQMREILAKISRVIVHTTHCAHLASTFMAR